MNAKEMVMPVRLLAFALISIVSTSVASASDGAVAVPDSGFVYVATNQPAGNSVIQFSRAPNGALTRRAETSTGGRGGTGNGVGRLDPLGSQDSLLLLSSGAQLLVVNAGSNTLASIAVAPGRLELRSNVPSGGQFPNSIAAHEDLVYVLNAHGTPNLKGFRLDAAGTLRAIPNSARDLPGGIAAAPHDVRFTPDGTLLLVSAGGTNRIEIFEVSNDGLLSLHSSHESSGSGPFGLNFGRDERLLVANAKSASVSSYALSPSDELEVITPSLPNAQMASCWISLAREKRHAFVSNTGSGTISSYNIEPDGQLQLSEAVAVAVPNSGPIDSAFSDDGQFLYVDDSAGGRILIFAVEGAGLTLRGEVPDLPTTLQGLAAR